LGQQGWIEVHLPQAAPLASVSAAAAGWQAFGQPQSASRARMRFLLHRELPRSGAGLAEGARMRARCRCRKSRLSGRRLPLPEHGSSWREATGHLATAAGCSCPPRWIRAGYALPGPQSCRDNSFQAGWPRGPAPWDATQLQRGEGSFGGGHPPADLMPISRPPSRWVVLPLPMLG